MGDTVRYDDNVEVYHNDGGCGEKVGELRLATRLERSDYVDEYTGNDRSEWAMSQKGFMWPLADNPDEFNFYYDYFGDQWECWNNGWAELTQNWNRSELDDLGIWEYDPSFSDETKTSLNTSISASAPKSVGVSVSVSFPKLKIQSDLVDHKLESTYDFWSDWGTALAAADEDVELGTVTAFDSLRPSDGDKIAPTYFYGRFDGYDWYCGNMNSCCVDCGRVTPDGSTFNFFYEQDINDL